MGRGRVGVLRASFALSVFLIGALVTPGTSASTTSGQNPKGRILGVAEPRSDETQNSSSGPQTDARRRKKKGNLSYHGGPVMQSSNTHAFFWEPTGTSFPFPPGYKTTVLNYFDDVANDSGLHTNVYSVGTQYHGNPGTFANYTVTSGHSYTLLDAYPASGCSLSGFSVCISDDQLETEITGAITAAADPDLHTGLTDIYFVFLPPGVGTCSSPSNCSYTEFCAYHSWIPAGSNTVLYTNQPYAAELGCDPGERPNANEADATLNVVSHEHNETITDPTGGGWWVTRTGAENGDKCNFDFGTTSGPFGSQFNQAINGRNYLLQQEWSNASPRGCRQFR